MREQSRTWQLGPDTPLQYLKGVGESRAALLHAAGLTTVRDLVFNFPYRYEDRSHPVTIRQLPRQQGPVALRGTVIAAATKTTPVKRMQIFEIMLDDGTGSVRVVWFRQPYLADQIHRNDRISVYGQARLDSYGRLVIENPQHEKIDNSGEAEDEGTIVPVYSAVKGIPSKVIRRLVQQALDSLPGIDDPLPPELRARLGVIGLHDAIVQLHHPNAVDEDLLLERTPAHRRMILEEFFNFQLALRMRRAQEEVAKKNRTIKISAALRKRIAELMPFKLTAAQVRVLAEIEADMTSDRPMYRLLQGDVGSGKTIVAVVAALIARGNRYQTALLAPTEILVEQHYERIEQLLRNSKVRLAKLTGSTPAAERRKVLSALVAGEIDFLIGTHAILEDKVIFNNLALVIVDEQHRFGVEQRKRLIAKGDLPDVLVMTATPIPRSLAISIFGDLDLSVIDELPPGRTPVKTVVRGTGQLPKVYDFIEKELADSAQAYIVYPLIEESEKIDLKPLMKGFEEIVRAFPNRRVAYLHGRMSSEEKEEVMSRFERHAIDLLVSTTVIEVGIDVPNASVMLIMDADRFGLAQMHQLRGRVGRGSRKSWCVLLRDEKASEEAKARLRSFSETTDGFKVAERDLEIRGEGDVLGTRQSGVPGFRFGQIVRDHRLMELARDVAVETIERLGIAPSRRLLRALRHEPELKAVSRD